MAIWTLLTQEGCVKKKYPQQKFAEFHPKRLHAYEFHKSRIKYIKYNHTFCRPRRFLFFFCGKHDLFCGPIPSSSIPEKKTPIYPLVTKQQPSPHFKATPVSSESECTCSVCFDHVMSFALKFSLLPCKAANFNEKILSKKSSKNPSTPTS